MINLQEPQSSKGDNLDVGEAAEAGSAILQKSDTLPQTRAASPIIQLTKASVAVQASKPQTPAETDQRQL